MRHAVLYAQRCQVLHGTLSATRLPPTAEGGQVSAREPHPLRAALAALGGSLKSKTVMSKNADPFRLDTDVHNRNGQWLQNTMADLGIPKRGKKIHSRGIHYAAQDAKVPMPKGVMYKGQSLGRVYLNDDLHSEWLEEIIGPSRWLGYVNWDDIRDKHSDQPVTRVYEPPAPSGWVRTNSGLIVPDEDDLTPEPVLSDFRGEQPYHVMPIGEKTSLEDILLPVAEEYDTGSAVGGSVRRRLPSRSRPPTS
jgi:hypothetical protein